MKKSILVVSLLAVLGLASCGDLPSTSLVSSSQSDSISQSENSVSSEGESSLASSSEETTSSSENSSEESISSSSDTPSSSDAPSSEASSSESVSSSEDSSSDTPSSSEAEVLEWKADDLADMKKAFDSDFTLPFPTDFTSEYVNGSMDYEGVFYFTAYDYNITSMDNYGAQLTEAGFEDITYLVATEDENDFYYSYHDDSKFGYYLVNFYFDTTYECWEIDAWYDEDFLGGYYVTDSFPYSYVSDFLNLEDADKVIPSFESASYENYTSGNGIFVLGKGDISLETSYKAALEALGYTIDDSQYDLLGYVATKEGLDFSITFYFEVDSFCAVFSKIAEEGDYSYVLDSESFASGYTTEDLTTSIGDPAISFTYHSIMTSSGASYFQASKVDSSKGRDPYLYNNETCGKITSIVLDVADTLYFGTPTLYVGTEVNPTETAVEGTLDGSTYSFVITGDYGFFRFENTSTQYAIKCNSLTINSVIE